MIDLATTDYFTLNITVLKTIQTYRDMIEQVGGLMGGLTGGKAGGRNSAAATGGANMAPNDTIYLCNFRQRTLQTSK
jgi:hypothetical protein